MGRLAMLAILPDAEVEWIIESNRERLSSYPGFSVSQLYEFVETTRNPDYSFNDGRVIRDMCAVGVPVMGLGGKPVAPISVAAITARLQPDRRLNVVNWLKAEAKALEKRVEAYRRPNGSGARPHLEHGRHPAGSAFGSYAHALMDI